MLIDHDMEQPLARGAGLKGMRGARVPPDGAAPLYAQMQRPFPAPPAAAGDTDPPSPSRVAAAAGDTDTSSQSVVAAAAGLSDQVMALKRQVEQFVVRVAA